jgi:hypothetical protein
MAGKNPLWVAKQHGHSVQVMLDVYAKWTDGAQESDVEAIKRAMQTSPRANSHNALQLAIGPLKAPEFGSRLAVAHPHPVLSRESKRGKGGGERGIRTQRRREPNQ